MIEKFYPDAVAKKELEVLDEAIEGAGIIALMENGMSAEYALKCRKPEDRNRDPLPNEKVEGDPLTPIEIISEQLGERDCFKEVEAIYEKVIKERQELASISPGNFETETEYKTALAEKAIFGDSDKWIAGMKKQAEVTTWADLKAAYTVEE